MCIYGPVCSSTGLNNQKFITRNRILAMKISFFMSILIEHSSARHNKKHIIKMIEKNPTFSMMEGLHKHEEQEWKT